MTSNSLLSIPPQKTKPSFLKGTAKIVSNKYVMIGAGAVAGSAAIYDVFTGGYRKGMAKAREEMGSNYVDLFVKSAHSSKYSPLMAKIKNATTDKLFDNSLYPAYAKTKNVIKATLGEVVNKAEPIALATGAIAAPLLFNKIPLIGAVPYGGAVVGGICTSVLLLMGAKHILVDVMGMGKKGL